MAGIEYQPSTLKGVIDRTPQRVRNRDGSVVLRSADGKVVHQEDGPILEMHRRAVEHITLNPTASAIVSENSCNTIPMNIKKS